MEYADEPPLVFSPLHEDDYCRFYTLEMAAYEDDAPFYRAHLHPEDHLLELGCGSGRLCRLLAPNCRRVSGIDKSFRMLHLASRKSRPAIAYVCGDMKTFAFAHHFDAIIIAYNTLNLLGDAAAAASCLERCAAHLRPGGRLLLHLYHPDTKLLEAEGERFFQFAINPLPDGGKLIKETLKSYQPDSEHLHLEERYRIRPLTEGAAHRDLRHHLTLYAPLQDRWLSLLADCGFSAIRCYGDFNLTPFSRHNSTTLLISAVR